MATAIGIAYALIVFLIGFVFGSIRVLLLILKLIASATARRHAGER